MRVRRRDVLKFATSSAAAAAAMKLGGKRAFAGSPKHIARDVCVLGGGAAGTYTAIRLRDLGKSVIVLEKKDRLGGHAETIHVGPANSPIDIGVVVYHKVPVVSAYFARLNVPMAPASFAPGTTAYVDYRTGQPVDYAPPSQAAFGAALGAYIQILQQQFPYLDSGYQLPNPVPADLLIPFGDFVAKYALDALVPTVYAFGEGLGNLFEDPTLYVLKNFSLAVASSIGKGTLIRPPEGTGQLYDAAAQVLGDDALVDACITRVRRAGDGIIVHAETADGPYRIHCKKLVVAFPPTPNNLAPLDLDAFESSTFNRFRSNVYATALVRLSGLPPGLSVKNVAPDTWNNLAPLPGIYDIAPTQVPGYYNVKYCNTSWLPDSAIKASIASDIARINAAGTLPVTLDGFHTFSSHAPFELMVRSDEIAHGFYRRLQSLQGRNDTFYTGATFQTHDSTLIWQFTENLLPQILA